MCGAYVCLVGVYVLFACGVCVVCSVVCVCMCMMLFGVGVGLICVCCVCGVCVCL